MNKYLFLIFLTLAIFIPFSHADAGTIVFVGSSGFKNNAATTSLGYAYTVRSTSTEPWLFTSALDVGGDIITGVSLWSGGTEYPMTQITKQEAYSAMYMYLFYLKNPPTGAGTVVVSASGANQINSHTTEYDGVSGTIDDSELNNSVSSNAVAAVATSTQDNSWAVTYVEASSGTLQSPGTNAVARSAGDGGSNIYDTNAPITPAGGVTMTITKSNTSGVMRGITAIFSPEDLAPPAVVGGRHRIFRWFNF